MGGTLAPIGARRKRSPPGLGAVGIDLAGRSELNHPGPWRFTVSLAQPGDGTIRLTPWQGVLLPHVEARDGDTVLARLAALGFATRPDDPLASLVACAGSTGCGRGLADTKADGLHLADAMAAAGVTADLHLSGCAKSCALARTAAFTLEAVAPGQYDLYARDDNAGHRFGLRLAEAISPESAIAFLKH